MVFKFLDFGRSKKLSSSSKKPCPTVIEELCTRFSLADLKKATNNFDEKNVIGRGVFTKVYKGYLKIDHVATAVSVKRRYKSLVQQGEEPIKMETKLLCQLRHPNLITLIGFCIHEDEEISVYEYMSNGSLENRRYARETLSWKKRLEICIGVARGLHYLHSGLKRTIIHRGVKPSNILLDDNMVPKLSDFRDSIQGQLFTEKPKPIEGKTFAGTIGYIPPETLYKHILTDKVDVYSFGVVLSEMVCGKSIMTIRDEMIQHEYLLQPNEEIEMLKNIFHNVTSGRLVSYTMTKLQAEDIDPALAGDIHPECYEAFIDIIKRCLKKEPNERPTMGEVEVLLEHALILQEEADATYTSDDYFSLFTSITDQQQAPISA